jgi:aspartate-semialdehyde dehydrogenase
MINSSPKVGIVGATGAVGQAMLDVMARREFPYSEVRLLASARSAGRPLKFGKRELTVAPLHVDSLQGLDLVLFSAGASISCEYAPLALDAGAVVIDNSSAFRMHDHVPLVIPEINPEAVRNHSGIIANPNCTTAIALMALAPLHRAFGLRRVIASSYQAVSGAGLRAMDELTVQTKRCLKKQDPEPEVFPHQIAFNVIPHIDAFEPNCYTREEMKLQNEGRKILGLPALRVSLTCVRVPVYRAHSVALTAEFERDPEIDAARAAIEKFPGVRVFDAPDDNQYPMPVDCAGKDDCYVGRLRTDTALDNGLSLWVCGDQILKGAALNAIQIAELLMK